MKKELLLEKEKYEEPMLYGGHIAEIEKWFNESIGKITKDTTESEKGFITEFRVKCNKLTVMLSGDEV